MKIAISAPSGYNSREILLPLHERLQADTTISEIQIISPAAPYREQLFPTFSEKFTFHANPTDQTGHDQLLKALAPNIVITPTVGLDPKDVPILRAAQKHHIPTLTFVASWDNVYKMERLRAKGHSGGSKGLAGDYVVPDYVAVWNQMNKEHILRSFPEVKEHQIEITGPPRFDYFAHHDRTPSREQLLTYIGYDNATPEERLIHGATTELYPFEYIMKAIAAGRDRNQLKAPVLLYASVHPGGDIAKHKSYEHLGARVKYSFGRREDAPLPEFKYLPTDQETYLLIALFKHTAVLVNQSSTVAIESFAADVPVINVKYGRRFDWWNWYRSMVYRDFKQHYRYITEEGATTIVHNDRQLIAALNRYLEHPAYEQAERRQTIKKMITYTDGTCGDRLIAYIKKAAA